jgi:hypothetical protein
MVSRLPLHEQIYTIREQAGHAASVRSQSSGRDLRNFFYFQRYSLDIYR